MKIFVSSTFKDMHAERDMLSKFILPEIEDFTRNYGEELTFIDLRWGINTQTLEDEEERAHKILSVCLDEIDESKPYFIAFLGERYGWIPEKRLIEKTLKEKPPEFSYLAELEKSVTALEIEYGALSQRGLIDRCLFYFREPLPFEKMSPEYRQMYCSEGEDCKRRLEELKERIVKSGGKIRYYSAEWDEENNRVTGLDDLEKLIIDNLKELIIKDFGEKKTIPWQKKEAEEAEFFFKVMGNRFSAREELCEDISNNLFFTASNLIVIKGDYGYGKSTLMGKLVANAREDGAYVLPIVCGQSKNTSDNLHVWRQLAYYLEDLLNQPHREGVEFELKPIKFDWKIWREYITGLLYECSNKLTKPVVIFMDAVDELTSFADFKDFFRRILFHLPQSKDVLLPQNNIVFVISCVEDYKIPTNVKEKIKYNIYTLDDLSREDKELVLHKLEERYQKEMPQEVKNRLVTMPLSKNPLYLFMMYYRMIMLDSDDFLEINSLGDGMEGQIEYMLRLVEDAPKSIDGVAAMIMEEAASRINKELCTEVLQLMAVSRRGLRKEDFEHIFERRNALYNANFDMVDFYLLKKYMRPFFFERHDGRFDFTYENFRTGILKNLSEQELRRINEEIYEFFEALYDKDPVRSYRDPVLREEYVWFAWKCDKKLEFLKRFGSRYIDPIAVSNGLFDVFKNDKGEWLIAMLKEYTEKEEFESTTYLRNAVKEILVMIRWDFSIDSKSIEEKLALTPIMEQAFQILEYLGKKPGAEKWVIDELKKFPYLIGDLYKRCEMYEKALEYYNKTLEIYKDLGDESHCTVGHGTFGNLYESWGKYDQALEYYRKELEASESSLKNKTGLNYEAFKSLAEGYERVLEFCKTYGMQDDLVEFQNKAEKYRELDEEFSRKEEFDQGLGKFVFIEAPMSRAAESKELGDNDGALEDYAEALKGLDDYVMGWNTEENLRGTADHYDKIAKEMEDLGNPSVSQECLQKSMRIKEYIAKKSEDQEWYFVQGKKWLKL